MTAPAKERGGREQARPQRIGICFNDYEPFYWDAGREDTCPGCPIEDDDHEERIEHRFYVPDDTDELREIALELEAARVAWNERDHDIADHRIAEVDRRLASLLKGRDNG